MGGRQGFVPRTSPSVPTLSGSSARSPIPQRRPAEIQRGTESGLRSHSGLGVGPPSGSPNPGPGWQLHSPAAPDPSSRFSPGPRGPDLRQVPRASSGRPCLRLDRPPPPVQLSCPSSSRRPARPSAPAEERSPENPRRAGGSAPVATPPSRPPAPGRSGPASAPLGVRATSSSGPRAGGGGASRRGGGASRAASCSRCPRRFPLCRPEDLSKPLRGKCLYLLVISKQIPARDLRFQRSDPPPTRQIQQSLPDR